MKSRFLTALAVTLGLVACGGIDGQLSVKQPITLKDRNGTNYSIPAGTYKINLNYKENKNRLIIEFDKLNGNKTKIESNTPDGFTIPENGPFSLKASDDGQNMDLDGTMSTTRADSREEYGQESCQYTTYETWCQVDPQGHQQCYQRPVTRNGYRDIRYFNRTTTQVLKAQFSKIAGTVAEINAQSSRSEQVVTWTGVCRW